MHMTRLPNKGDMQIVSCLNQECRELAWEGFVEKGNSGSKSQRLRKKFELLSSIRK